MAETKIYVTSKRRVTTSGRKLRGTKCWACGEVTRRGEGQGSSSRSGRRGGDEVNDVSLESYPVISSPTSKDLESTQRRGFGAIERSLLW